MKITVHGAGGGEVTGSAYLVQTKTANVLVDFGMFQGHRKLENHNKLPTREGVKNLHAVVLTHAHLDHTGRLPMLTKVNYRGPIFATPATIELTQLILKDSARLHQADVERENRKRLRQGRELLEPLYGTDEVDQIRPLFRPLKYDASQQVAPGVTVEIAEAGHIFGAVSLAMTVEENGTKKTIVFSGDIGPRGAPLHQDPRPFKKADVVFMESTYGDKDHKSLKETAAEACKAIAKAVAAGGKVLVPTFAIGRTQILLYMLAGAFERGMLRPFPIFVDSPMGIEATKIYRKHLELFDGEALAMQRSGELSANLKTAQFCQTATESRALNERPGPFMILAGAGMCNGGRILHHLRHNLRFPETLVLMVGFQGQGSLGRMLQDGCETVTIMGEKILVRAKVHSLGGLSGHAGQGDLLRWFSTLAPCKPRLILTHGEDRQRKTLAGLIHQRHGIRGQLPALGETIEI